MVELHDTTHRSPHLRLQDELRRIGLYPADDAGDVGIWQFRPVTYCGSSVLDEGELKAAIANIAATLDCRATILITKAAGWL